MDDRMMMMLLAGFAGLLCLASVALLVGVFVAWSRRQAEATQKRPVPPPPVRAATPRPAVPPPAPAAPRAQVSAKTEPPAGAGLPGPDFTEDEMPTVVVASPTRPPAGSPATPPAPPPSRRSAGATIIAFDEDDGDEDE